jgi:hypothetical protein
MVEIAYVLNVAVSLLCTVLLFNGWRRSHSRLLVWSACCFALLSLNGAFILVDVLVVGEDADLSVVRDLLAFAGFSVLLFGLIWEA